MSRLGQHHLTGYTMTIGSNDAPDKSRVTATRTEAAPARNSRKAQSSYSCPQPVTFCNAFARSRGLVEDPIHLRADSLMSRIPRPRPQTPEFPPGRDQLPPRTRRNEGCLHYTSAYCGRPSSFSTFIRKAARAPDHPFTTFSMSRYISDMTSCGADGSYGTSGGSSEHRLTNSRTSEGL